MFVLQRKEMIVLYNHNVVLRKVRPCIPKACSRRCWYGDGEEGTGWGVVTSRTVTDRTNSEATLL